MLRFLSVLLLASVAVTMISARNPGQFSPPGCGPNSREDSCTDGCVPTCDAEQNDQCIPADDGCVPDCACFPGYVKNPSGHGCIQQSECENYL